MKAATVRLAMVIGLSVCGVSTAPAVAGVAASRADLRVRTRRRFLFAVRLRRGSGQPKRDHSGPASVSLVQGAEEGMLRPLSYDGRLCADVYSGQKGAEGETGRAESTRPEHEGGGSEGPGGWEDTRRVWRRTGAVTKCGRSGGED
jgi:hypothetical protein